MTRRATGDACAYCGQPIDGPHVFALVRLRRGGAERQVRLHQACVSLYEQRNEANIVELLDRSAEP